MNRKWVNLVIGAVFLIVGIIATVNGIRLHDYIEETLPRDQRQEDCQNQTLEVLRYWVEARNQRDDSVDVRDDAIVAVIDSFMMGGTPQEQQQRLAELRGAVDGAHKTRDRVSAEFESRPLPAGC